MWMKAGVYLHQSLKRADLVAWLSSILIFGRISTKKPKAWASGLSYRLCLRKIRLIRTEQRNTSKQHKTTYSWLPQNNSDWADCPLACFMRALQYAQKMCPLYTCYRTISALHAEKQILTSANGTSCSAPQSRDNLAQIRLPLYCFFRVRTPYKCLAFCNFCEDFGRCPLPLLNNHSALALFTQHTRIPTSSRSTGFCVIWVCISSSSKFLHSRKYASPNPSTICSHQVTRTDDTRLSNMVLLSRTHILGKRSRLRACPSDVAFCFVVAVARNASACTSHQNKWRLMIVAHSGRGPRQKSWEPTRFEAA